MKLFSVRLRLMLVCLLICFSVWQAPARLVEILLPERLVLTAVSGSFWSGEAGRSALQLDDGALALGRASWHFSPLSLLLLRPTVTLSVEWGGQQLTGVFTRELSGIVAIKHFHARFESGLIRQFLPLYIGGRVIADFSEIAIASDQILALDGKLLWQNAVWAAAAGDVPLGDYQLSLSSDNNRVQGQVTTLSGTLVVAGDVVVAESDYEIDLDLSGPATRDPELACALQLLAAPKPTGFVMVIKGSF